MKDSFEAWKDKDETIKSLEELRFLALSTKRTTRFGSNGKRLKSKPSYAP
nr:hypothetical protein [Tanacetum cinerariifolium]